MTVPGVQRTMYRLTQSRRWPFTLLCQVFLYEWFSRLPYDSEHYREFQKLYWETIGVLRWADSAKFDYTDMLRTLERHRLSSDSSLLELGCGNGDLLCRISSRFPALRLTGIDASKPMCTRSAELNRNAEIIEGFYGPGAPVGMRKFDIVIARSTLTYVDEADVGQVLQWITQVCSRLLVISEPSGIHDQLQAPEIIRVTADVYKRKHDHTHIRDYSKYSQLSSFRLSETPLEDFNDGGNREWIFVRSSVEC